MVRDRLSLSVDSPKYAYPIGNKGTERDSEGVSCQFHKSYLQIGFWTEVCFSKRPHKYHFPCFRSRFHGQNVTPLGPPSQALDISQSLDWQYPSLSPYFLLVYHRIVHEPPRLSQLISPQSYKVHQTADQISSRLYLLLEIRAQHLLNDNVAATEIEHEFVRWCHLSLESKISLRGFVRNFHRHIYLMWGVILVNVKIHRKRDDLMNWAASTRRCI